MATPDYLQYNGHNKFVTMHIYEFDVLHGLLAIFSYTQEVAYLNGHECKGSGKNVDAMFGQVKKNTQEVVWTEYKLKNVN